MHRAIFDALPDAVVIVDHAGTIMMANRKAYQLFGYAQPELVGRPVEMLIPQELREPHQRHRRLYEREPSERPMGAASMALLGLRRDGSRFPVEIALSPIRISHGPQVLASIRDISRTSMAQRVERKARHDAALVDIGQRVMTSAAEDRVLHDVACDLSESVGVGPVWLLLRDDARGGRLRGIGLTTPPADWMSTQARGLLARLVPGEALRARDGRIGDAALPTGMRSGLAFPLVLEDRSTPAALVAFSYDPDAFDTDLERLLQTTASLLSTMLQRQRSSEALAHARRLEAIGKLTGGVAHDFNNLLTVVSGNLQMLEDRIGDDVEGRALLEAAVRAVDQGAALTRKLLSFAGRQRLRPAIVSLPRQVQDLERLVRATLGERIRLRVTVDPGVPPVRVDPALLDSAVLNLVLNARDAIEETGEVEIVVRADPGTAGVPSAEAGFVELSVRDTGCGMSEDALAHAWEPFFTTKAAGHGTGLGLSMVYGFIRQSGGHVQLLSRTGEGTTVTLYLPAATEADCDAIAERAPLAGGSEVVLVVEDDTAVRATVEASLKSLGYHVIATASPRDALECVESLADIALLFTDLALEGDTSGAQLAQRARQLRPDLAVLLTSGYPDAALGERADRFALLPKPYHKEDLARAVRDAIAATRQMVPAIS